ncbi:MAG: glycoside hydrolase family 36 protein [Anaerolineales bacterium]
MTDSFLDTVKISADSIQETGSDRRLTGVRASVELPEAPVRYLYSGWQSWSLTTWVDTRRPVRRMRPVSLNPMQTDPAYAGEIRPNGSWYGAVEFSDGQVLLLGALGLDSHVRLEGKTLIGWYEEGAGEWFLACGEETEIFDRYAGQLKERFGAGRIAKSPRVWCSWYSLYTLIHEEGLVKILHDLGDLPFDVFQVDDGWQNRVGDWEPNAKFPAGMATMAARIKESGRKAGLWLAPLLAVPSSSIYREHRDWLLKDKKGRLVSAGFNWGEQLYALDTTHPEALDWLKALMQKVRAWGYEYAKLDFLYAGALPGQRHVDIPREAAYRNALKVIREALEEAYLLACGAPIFPSLGLCDGLRIGPDVADHWASARDDALLMNFAIPGGRNALRTSLNRLWLHPLVHTDPDVAYFRTKLNNLTGEQKALLQDLARIADFKATSDIPVWLVESERAGLRAFLEDSPRVQKINRTYYEINGRRVDFSDWTSLPPQPNAPSNILGAIIGGLADLPATMKLLDALDHDSLRKKLAENPV